MSIPLTAEEQAKYTRHIDKYLRSCDLSTVTRKKVRQALQDAIDKDLSAHKAAIKQLIEERFDAIQEDQDASPEPTTDIKAEAPDVKAEQTDTSPEPNANGHSPSDNTADSNDTDADRDAKSNDNVSADGLGKGEIQVATEPPKKKVKKETKREISSEDADARLAAELQAQEEKLARGRTTRGGGKTKETKKSKPKHKKTKPKSAKRVRDDDDSNISGADSGAEKPKSKARGGFQKPFNLSHPLAELCGETQLSRPQVVKKLWEHIKGNELQDPSDRRQIMCDDAMQAVFKIPRVDMFQMNKLVGKHLYPVEEEE